MEREWIYLQNPFANATVDNFSKFNSVINYSYGRFKAREGDTFFDTVLAILTPSHTAWNNAYNAWINSQAYHKSTTNTVQEMIGELSSKFIGSWVRKIAVVYEPGSSNYIRLLPHESAPFQTGKQADRIAAVGNLVTAIGTDPALTTVKNEADAFFTDITKAKNEQNADLGDTDDLSDALELQRLASSVILWKTLGMMIAQFADTPSGMGNYYDQANLRSVEQVSFTHTVRPSATITLVKRKLVDTMQIKVVNDSDAEIRAYYAAEKNDAIGLTFVTVPARQEVTVAANTLGNITTGHFIKVLNINDLVDAHFTLSIIK